MDSILSLPNAAQILLALHVAAAIALFLVQFSRATKTSRSTRPAILLSFWLLTAASVVALFAPLVLPRWQPSYETIFLLISIAAVQWVTARYWKDGTPREFTCDR